MAAGGGPMKTMPGLGAGLGEAGILRQEAVARMDRLRAGVPGRRDDPVGHQVALARRRPADMDGLVGHRDVARVAVGVGIDGDRLDAEPPRRLDDPAGDLAAIGDQDLGEHQARPPRLALVEEGLHAFERLVGRALRRRRARRSGRRPRHRAASASISVTSSLISRLDRGRAELQLARRASPPSSSSVVGLHDLIDQADAQRRRGIEYAAMHQELARQPRAHRLDQHRDGDAGQQAVAHRGQAEPRRRRRRRRSRRPASGRRRRPPPRHGRGRSTAWGNRRSPAPRPSWRRRRPAG